MPPGASDIPGLEVAGVVAAVGADVRGWSIGEPICALLAGGGYAERAVAPQEQCLPIPKGLSAIEAAGIPGNVLHRLDQRLSARPPEGGRDRS